MAKENETIADIIAEKRREANYIVQVSQGKCQTRRDKAEDEARDIRREADRIEAALKRERGDVAKLREALSKFCAYSAVVLNAGMFNRVHLEALLNMANAALAAPPRNCDRFGGDNAKLQKVYYSECGKEYDPQDPISRQTYLVGYGNWLLSPPPATEKEGGAK